MIIKKKMIVAVAAAVGVLGGNVQAAFVKYDLNTVAFNDGAVASGYFYQDTSNNAIVYCQIEIPGTTSQQGRVLVRAESLILLLRVAGVLLGLGRQTLLFSTIRLIFISSA